MSKKEKVFIVVTHKHIPVPGQKTGAARSGETKWQVSENVEFVSSLKTRHYTMSTAIGDYINKKMLSGERSGMGEFEKFEIYIRSKYEKEMKELDKMYRADQVEPEPVAVEDITNKQEVISDQFGNIRAKTIFDAA